MSLAWLAEQFRRKHYKLTHVSTELQAADILTKPFTSAEKGQMDYSGKAAVSPRLEKSEARNTDSHPNHTLVEACCSHESKLGDTSRRPAVAVGCHVIPITEDDDILSHATRKRVIDKRVRATNSKIPIPRLVWASIPCTGGTAWSHINMNPAAARERRGRRSNDTDLCTRECGLRLLIL